MTSFWFGTTLLALFWGGSYLAIRIVIADAPPFGAAAVRIAICALLSFLTVRLRRPEAVERRWKVFATINGLFLMGIPWALLFWAEKVVLPSLAALMMAALPIFTLIFAPLLTPKEKTPSGQWIGVAVGFLGLFLLVLPSWQSPERSHLWGVLALLGVALGYALGTLGIRRISPHMTLVSNLFYESLGGIIFLIPFLLTKEEFTPWRWSLSTWGALLYLGIGSTFIAWLLYFQIVRRYGAVMASVIPYFPPLVALTLDRFFLKTLPETISIVGGMVILCGVYLTQRFRGTS